MTDYNGFTNAIMPVGIILPFPTGTIPSNFFECDGSLITITGYEVLFGMISNTFGGNGTTHFAIPDYQDYFVRGLDELGAGDPEYLTRTDRGDGTGGAVIGSKQGDDFEEHDHPVRFRFTAQTTGNTPPSIINGINGPLVNPYNRTLRGQTGGLSETRPDNVRVIYAIKVL